MSGDASRIDARRPARGARRANDGLEAPSCGVAAWQVPCNTQLDKQLIAGGVLFGAGWGVCGSCPGPMLVNLVTNANAMSAAMVGAMMLGMAAAVPVKPLFSSEKSNKSSW